MYALNEGQGWCIVPGSDHILALDKMFLKHFELFFSCIKKNNICVFVVLHVEGRLVPCRLKDVQSLLHHGFLLSLRIQKKQSKADRHTSREKERNRQVSRYAGMTAGVWSEACMPASRV